MKHVFLILMSVVCSSHSQSVTDYPLRRFGTNVFDFTTLIQSFQRGTQANTPYLIAGRVYPIEGTCAYVVSEKTELRVSQKFQRDMLLAGPGDQLRMLYVIQLLQRPHGISAGEFYALSPETKQLYLDAAERVVTKIQVFVTNCPTAYLVQAKSVRFFAIPIGTASSYDIENGTQSIQRYDYGQPVTEDPKSLTNVWSVTTRGFVRVETAREAASRKAGMAVKLLYWQQEQASNGVAYIQFDLAKRYFEGDGVAKDEKLATYWLEQSANQGFDDAVKLLERRQKKEQ